VQVAASHHSELSRLLDDARDYQRDAEVVALVHFHMSDVRAWANQIVGGLTVLSAAAVSTGILAVADGSPGHGQKLAAGILAFVAAVLAGLQSFFKFGVSGEKHRTAGANYLDVKMRLDVFIAEYADAVSSASPDAIGAALKELQSVQTQISNLNTAGPGYPTHI
jgi:hypothetical protein